MSDTRGKEVRVLAGASAARLFARLHSTFFASVHGGRVRTHVHRHLRGIGAPNTGRASTELRLRTRWNCPVGARRRLTARPSGSSRGDLPGAEIRSPSVSLDWSAVVHLVRYARLRGRPSFNRCNLFARDFYRCQYCGAKSGLSLLTLDHVVPRAQAKDGTIRLANGRVVPVHGWENVVASCWPCNFGKAARTPSEAGMTLRTVPKAPSPHDVIRFALRRMEAPDPWQLFLSTTDLS
jgi:5-methylcytosine-specific restriction endonuclease McrA